MVPVPIWNSSGVLPPSIGDLTSRFDCSPYLVSLTDLVSRFGYTGIRRRILGKFLAFRQTLHAAGLTNGFQWVNGSFVEDIQLREQREPRDIDVVTFYYIPDGYDQQSLYSEFSSLFDHRANVVNYSTDAFFVSLDTEDKHYLAHKIAYWNGLWSHTRDEEWKGYLEIDPKISDSVGNWPQK